MELDDVKNLLKALEGTAVTELEWQVGEARLRIARAGGSPVPHASTGPIPSAAPAIPAAPSPAAPVASEPPPAEAGLSVVTSPIVGTFYRAPDPASAPFVSVGDRVRVGQVLCIVEAMKLMNEIEAEVAGEIVKVHPESGQPVQYGEPLFTLRPDK